MLSSRRSHLKLLRVLRMLDDLAEIVLFDHVLSTPRRRRLALACVGATAFFAYASSGFWLAPPPLPPRAPAAAPLFLRPVPGLCPAHVDLAAEIVREHTVSSAQLGRLAAAMRHYDAELDSTVALVGAGDGRLQPVCRALGLTRTCGLVTMLLARGKLSVSRCESSAAVRDWITALRVTATMTEPGGDMTAHAVGGVMQNTAVRLLGEALDTGVLCRSEREQIRAALADQTELTLALALEYERESERLRTMLSTWAETGRLPAEYAGLRFYLPVVESSRRAVAKQAADLIDWKLFTLARTVSQGDRVSPRPPVQIVHVRGWAFHVFEGATWTDRIATLWSNDRAATLCANLLLCWRSSATDDYARSCQRLDADTRKLIQNCAMEPEI